MLDTEVYAGLSKDELLAARLCLDAQAGALHALRRQLSDALAAAQAAEIEAERLALPAGATAAAESVRGAAPGA